jgi:calcineurin-like phosphoesterase family protein
MRQVKFNSREHYLNELGSLEPGSKRTRARNHKDWHYIPEVQNPRDFSVGKVWVWSDLHFGHKNIIRFSDRPYPDVETMDEHLVLNFNDYVGPDDISIWVGDVSFHRDPNRTYDLVNQCNGYKILIVGNHDFGYHSADIKDMGFDETHLLLEYEDDDISLLFTHYPINVPAEWVNVHGHEHIQSFDSPYKRSRQHINVCCELHQYKPIDFDDIRGWAKTRTVSYDKPKQR